jgi:UbiD family decarboxylase
VHADRAPCKQNIARGADIDLYRFPTPVIHGNDGGRYIQTYGMNIVATPDGAWTNWSVNRMVMAGSDRLACVIPDPQHLGIIRAQRTARGEPMPTRARGRARPADGGWSAAARGRG